MEILDPDLWNDDGTPKKPTKEYMARLEEAQRAQGGAFAALAADESFLNYARVKRQAREARSPEVGDIVHFWDEQGAACRAAIVMETESFGDGAMLRVHVPHQPFSDWQCDHDEDKGHETWHWPCGEGQ